MSHLPVIIGFGGINAAGRASFHHAYQRMVLESLPAKEQEDTIVGLAALMNLVTYKEGTYVDTDGRPLSRGEIVQKYVQVVKDGTLVRRIDDRFFAVNATPWQKNLSLNPLESSKPVTFKTSRNHLPEPLPASWKVTELNNGSKDVQVEIFECIDIKVPSSRVFPVQSAGILPSGFDPQALYPARSHPRGLQMTIYAASDALRSTGIEWQEILKHVAPDQVAVYAGSAMSQLDYDGSGGMLQARLGGRKVTSKQCALGFCEMPADFVNAYILGSVGSTGTSAGACATFLYNLRLGIDDIQSGRRRFVMVGTSEAPVISEIADGYAAMGALATDADLMSLDGSDKADNRRASRPFGENCGFTLAESSQFIVLCDDDLALQLGATIYGAVGSVFVNADGFKKSISGPGAGNYITMAKALASARALVGEEAIAKRSFVQAHGSSTPQNRVTESHILNEAAKIFGMTAWPVAAMKSYLGHSIGSAGGDQITATLGVWKHGFIPGIKTISKVADDVHHSHLRISNQDFYVGKNGADIDVAVINSKGFGGNNASATILAPHIVEKMLTKKHGAVAINNAKKRNVKVAAEADNYNQQSIRGESKPIYLFDHGVIDSGKIKMEKDKVTIPGFDTPITLPKEPAYADMV
jgi:acetoacetyl-[acyl-carrier protein] synthase